MKFVLVGQQPYRMNVQNELSLAVFMCGDSQATGLLD